MKSESWSAKTAGVRKLFTSTYTDPAAAAMAAEMPNETVLWKGSETPDETAAISLSRTARNALPVRPRRSSHAKTNATAATAHAT